MAQVARGRLPATVASVARRPQRPRSTQFLRAFRRQPRGVVGLLVTLLFLLCALLAPLIAPMDPAIQASDEALVGPSLRHLLGTDELGRDIFSRIVYGSRISLQVGLVAVGIALLVGIPFGLVAGYWGGWVDNIVMRLIDAFLAFPTLVLALAITAALGANLRNAMIAIGAVYVPTFARLIRVQALSIKNLDYVEAARTIGASHPQIMLRHIWPNVIPLLVIQASISVGFAILAEASLSFLGLGAQPPTPAWGSMLQQGYPFMDLAPWLAIAPGAAIFVVVLGFNFIGDGIRDAADPRLRNRGG